MIRIKEEWVNTYEEVDIFLNPTPREMIEIYKAARTSTYKTLRFIAYPNGDFYIWSGDEVMHRDIELSYIGMKSNAIYGVVMRGRLTSVNYASLNTFKNTDQYDFIAKYFPEWESWEHKIP